MDITQDDQKSYYKLAQLWQIIKSRKALFRSLSFYSNKRVVNNILKEDFNINYKITKNRDVGNFEICSTALHMLAFASFDIDIFNNLLERGADFTMKNEKQQTALHLLIARHNHYGRVNAPFIDAILSAHVKFNKTVNPLDDNGLSHFHGACITNHVGAIEWFLQNGTSISEAVDLKAPRYAGYTPLHFAADFGSFEVAQILVSRGANINVKDTREMCPIDLLVERRLEILADVNDLSAKVDYSKKTRLGKLKDSEKVMCHKSDRIRELSNNAKIIKLLLEKACVSGVGLTTFHVACTLKDLTIAQSLLKHISNVDYSLSMKLDFRPGYTAAHFAAINGVDAVKMLSTHGATIMIEDARGVTALDICLRNYSLQDICTILSCTDNLRDICLPDGKTRLLDFVQASASLDQFKQYLQKNVEGNIHLTSCANVQWAAVMYSTKIVNNRNWLCANSESVYDETIVKECLKRGISINGQNERGQTPIHVAFRLGKMNIAQLLIKHLIEIDQIVNKVDDDNLSYLHIASALKDENFVTKLLLNNADPNITYKGKRIPEEHIERGSTPLHTVAANKSSTIAEMLLKHGADLHATDDDGLTPIHWLLKVSNGISLLFCDVQVSEVLFDSWLAKPKDHVVDKVGLSYLHVACANAQTSAAQKLVDLGSNINATINYENTSSLLERYEPLRFLADYSEFTPLDCARRNPDPNMLDLFLRRRGTKGFESPNLRDNCFLLENINLDRPFFLRNLLYVSDEQKFIEERLGLTNLHIACYMKDEEKVERTLRQGVDNVNVQTPKDCLLFPGCTPLHLLMTVVQLKDSPYKPQYEFTVAEIINSLVIRGVDVTIQNADGDTPIHLFYKYQYYFTQGDRCKNLLLNAHRDFNVNPSNADGISHFHLACLWHKVEIVEQFLLHRSIDINQQIDYFSINNPGFTPLHLALINGSDDSFSARLDMFLRERTKVHHCDWAEMSQLVGLLLKNGANVAVKDIRGDTALHKNHQLLSPEGASTVKKLMSYGADIRSENSKGETAMEKWLPHNWHHCIKIFQENVNNEIYGWNRVTGEGYIAKLFLSDDSEQENNITEIIEFKKLIQSSNVRIVDEMDRTVIHNAVACMVDSDDTLENFADAIEIFMKQGVDIDYQDKTGKTALHYAARMYNARGVRALLQCGADLDIVDSCGKSAYFYATEHLKKNYCLRPIVMNDLSIHIQKLQLLGIDVSSDVSKLNQDLANYTDNIDNCTLSVFTSEKMSTEFWRQVEITKTLNVGIRSLTLFHFLSETCGVSLYTFLPKSERDLIDDFFSSIDYNELDQIAGIIKLQIRKTTIRIRLIDSALSSLRTLLGFSVPGLCEHITMFLSHSDLKRLIASTIVEGEN